MSLVQIQKLNEVYCIINAELSTLMELSNFFTFDVPGAKFSPQYRAKKWDGKIRLLNTNTRKIYIGLTKYIEHYCNEKGYKLEYLYNNNSNEFSIKEAEDFVKTLNLTLTPRDYQIESFVKCVRDNRALLLSPTSSGKSLIIYLLYRYYNKKTLLIVPTTGLIHQMYSDFLSYGYEDVDNIHKIYEGQNKDTNSQLVISTWQSIFELPKKWFSQFDTVIGDECVHPNTKIIMSDNSKKEIKNIKIGDFVKTYNEKTKCIENKKVIKVHQNISITKDFYEIETLTGIKLKITGNHKVLLKTGIWKKVEDLKVGDIINSIE